MKCEVALSEDGDTPNSRFHPMMAIFSLFFPTGICHIFALFQVGGGTELSSKNGRRGDGRREQGLEERNINKPPKSNFRFMKFLNTNHQVFIW